MSLWDRITNLMAVGALQERDVLFETQPVSVEEQITDLQRRRAGYHPWRPASIRDALSVPSIFGIVSMIANTIGTLTLEAYRNGVKLPPDQRPSIIVRPDPRRRPGSFWRDTAWNVATRGEAWWWVAKRDSDGSGLSLYNVPPQEITVTDNDRDPLRPLIEWRGRQMPNDDMRQITFIREPGELRGSGPLQMCGAAVSVAVESQQWAANFYADGGNPSTVIKHASELGGGDLDAESEAEALRNQWTGRPNNVPRIIDQNIESVEYLQPNEQGAQMLSARDFQVGEVARMFSYPQSLIGYAVPGSSVTYQNVGQELDKLTRTCLIPHFLEKFEQEMTDLLSRTHACEFNVDRLLRADAKTRWEVYKTATEVIGPEEAATWARQAEGFEAGSVETAPIPFAPLRAFITALPVERSRDLRELRCAKCNRLAGRVSGSAEIKCQRCGELVTAA